MEQAGTVPDVAAPAQQSVGLRVADICAKAIFVSLLCLIVFTAIPYGTAEAWWKAFFICALFALVILALIECCLRGSWTTPGLALLFPLFTLTTFSFLQTLSFGTATSGGANAPWTAISADPYATRFFALQLLALALAAALFYRYASNERRVRILIHVIIGVVVASAIFGILRQTTQHSEGFFLPLIKPDQGYGQFINRNHFAFLMEMGLGLALGMLVGGGVRRERALIYVAALLPIWTALVLSNSRGGLLAMAAQLIAGVLLFTFAVPASTSNQFKVFTVARSLPARLLLLLILLLSVVVGTVWMGGDRLVSRLDEAAEYDPAAVSRNEMWRATWKMFQAHPVAGVGMAGYWVAVPAHHSASGKMVPQEAHNEYLELLASGGVIGGVIGAWFCILLFRRTRANLRSRNHSQRAACFGASLGIIGVAVHSLFDFGLHMIVNALIFTALVVIATNARSQEHMNGSRNA